MFTIKLEDDKNVVVKFSLKTGLYDQKNKYKIDLTNKRYYLIKTDEIIELEWELAYDALVGRIEELISIVKSSIINNREVIYSARKRNDIQEIDRSEKFLNKNLRILNFLEDYVL